MITRQFSEKIQLSNEGQLSLFFVGTGNAFSKTNFQTNIVVVKGNDNFLIDCGTMCSYALSNLYNTNISEFNTILLTHPHADHIGGMEEAALAGMYIKKRKVNLVIPKPFKKKLWNESLRGGIQFSENGKKRFEDYFTIVPSKLIQKRPFTLYETNVGGINIKLFRTKHVTESSKSYRNSILSYGVLIENKVLFSGDIQFSKEQLEWLVKEYPTIEVIFHDCDVLGKASGVHASYNQLCTLSNEIKQKMYLVHYDSAIENVNPLQDGFAGVSEKGIYYDF